MLRQVKEKGDVLADQKNIDGTEVEVIEVGHGRHALSASMHASIKLHTCQTGQVHAFARNGIHIP